MKLFFSRPLIILLIYFCTSAYTTVPEKLNFGVYFGSQKIGSLTTSKVVEEKRISYLLHSEVIINLLMDIKIVEQINDVFENGYLKTSCHTRHVNNTLKVKNMAARGTNAYVLTKDGKPECNISKWIAETVCSLYFKEPNDQTRTYSQNYQKILNLKKTLAHTYTMTLPDGKTTSFEYRSGKLYAVISNTTWGSVKFIREN